MANLGAAVAVAARAAVDVAHGKLKESARLAVIAKVLEDENITSDDFKEMTKRTKRKTEERIAQLRADTLAIQEQNRKEARAAKRKRRELESQLDALLTQRKRTRDV